MKTEEADKVEAEINELMRTDLDAFTIPIIAFIIWETEEGKLRSLRN